MANTQPNSPAKPKPATAAKPAAPGQRGRRAPLLLETAYAISFSVTLLAGLATAAISALAGAPAWLIAVRAGLAIVVLGLVFWMVFYQLMHGVFAAAVQDLRERAPDQAGRPAASTQEWKA